MTQWAPQIWSSNLPTYAPGSMTGAAFELLAPAPFAGNVSQTPLIRVALLLTEPATLVPSTFTITIDDVLVFSPMGIPESNYVCKEVLFAGHHIVSITPRSSLPYGSKHTVVAAVDDTVAGAYSTTWSFTVMQDSAVFTGASLAPIEQALLAPMDRFLDVEPLRLLLLRYALRDGISASNRDALAVRALYQMAYDTEVSSILNAYITPDPRVLASIIAQKRKSIEIDAVLQQNRRMIDIAIDNLFREQVLPREYRDNLVDYSESLLYPYRVSMAAAIVLFARGVETFVAPDTDFRTGVGDDIPFDIGG